MAKCEGVSNSADTYCRNMKYVKADEGPTAYGSDARDPVNEGYSIRNNVYPLYSKNLWSRSHPVCFQYTSRRREYIDLNCSTDCQKPFILPYLSLPFWINSHTANYKTWIKLMDCAIGFNILNAFISVDCHTVERQRLISQGSTNVLTYDFETSQNLIIGHYDRLVFRHSFDNATDFTSLKLKSDVEFFSNLASMGDPFTYEEVPQKHSWKYHIPIVKCQDGFFGRPITSTDLFKRVLPLPQVMRM